MTTRIQTSRKGFTLIELLTVIAIIGILASILIPTIGNVIDTARKAAASANAGSIAKTYVSFSNNGSNSRTIMTAAMGGGNATTGTATSIEDVAFILSKTSQLNDGSLWFIKSDEALNGAVIPKSVIAGDPNVVTTCAPDFQKLVPKSWAFVTGISTTAQSTTTPLLWTYGLQETGVWVNNSPWKGHGGHMAYLDGHVDWYDKLTLDNGGSCLTGYPTGPKAGQSTVDYKEAINSGGARGAVVVNAMGQ